MLVAVVLLLLFCTCVDFVVLMLWHFCLFLMPAAQVRFHALFVFLQVKPHDGVRQANMSRQGHLIVAHPDVQGQPKIKFLKDVAACHFGMLGEAFTGVGRAEIQPCYAVPGKGTCLGCKSHWLVVKVGETNGAVSPPYCGNLLLKLFASVILQVSNYFKCYFLQVLSH